MQSNVLAMIGSVTRWYRAKTTPATIITDELYEVVSTQSTSVNPLNQSMKTHVQYRLQGG